MPEGPELYLASCFINAIARRTMFGGKVVKSAVSTKNPDVEWECEEYFLRAISRGKELKLTLLEGREEGNAQRTLDVLFRFGMSGSFKYTSVSDKPKHAHLMFYTVKEETPMVLSFVDYRRFGRWEVGGTWGKDRGPDPMWDYQNFRHNVLTSLEAAPFTKPICETMLNQKYFNGIGNYLRAEILFRCGVRPFDEAKEVLSELKPFSKWYEQQSSCKEMLECDVQPDLLDLCHIVPLEVTKLGGGGKGYNVDPDADEDEYKEFKAWLRCYSKDGMSNLVDHNKRTMWFSGHQGRLVPKDTNSRMQVKRKKSKNNGNFIKKKEQKSEVGVNNEDETIKAEINAKKPKIAPSRTKSKYLSSGTKKMQKVTEVCVSGNRYNTRLAMSIDKQV